MLRAFSVGLFLPSSLHLIILMNLFPKPHQWYSSSPSVCGCGENEEGNGFFGTPRAVGSVLLGRREARKTEEQHTAPPPTHPWTECKGHWGWSLFLFPPSGW